MQYFVDNCRQSTIKFSRLSTVKILVDTSPNINVIDHLPCLLQPFNSWITDKKDTTTNVSDMIEVIKRSLDDGFLPVLHGDAVLDRSRGCCILGGDAIMEVS